MLIDLDFEHVLRASAVIGPDVLLPELYPVQRLCRQPVAHLRELLRVRERAAVALDRAGLAADVEGRAHMAERIGLDDLDLVTGLELRFSHASRPPPSYGRAPRW